MKTSGEVIIDAVIRSSAIERAVLVEDATIFVWSSNAAEQIEAAIREAGYALEPDNSKT